VDQKHPTMGSLMLLLSLPLFHSLILCGVVSTNDGRWVVPLSFSHSLSLTLSRSLALLLSCSLARSLSRSPSWCVHKRPTVGSLSRSLSFSPSLLSLTLTHSLARLLARSLSCYGSQTSDDWFSQSVTFTPSLSLTHSLWYRVHKRPTMGSFFPSLSHVPTNDRWQVISRSLPLLLSRSLARLLSRSRALALPLFVSSH